MALNDHWNSEREFGIPTYTEIDYTYVGSTNNVATKTFINASGNTVAVLTYSYVAAGAADNDKVSKVQRTT